MSLDWRRFAPFAVVVAILAPPLAVSALFWSALRFDPVVFVNAYLGFIFDAIAVLLGFVLLNVFWQRQSLLRRERILRRQLLLGLRQLSDLVAGTLALLSAPHPPSDRAAATRVEQDALRKIAQMQSLRRILALHSPSIEVPESDVARAHEQFTATAGPMIEDLGQRVAIYPHGDEVVDRLSAIQDAIDATVKAIQPPMSGRDPTSMPTMEEPTHAPYR